MQVFTSIEDLQKVLKNQRTVALVPTMGNLHDGHLSLMKKARQEADFVVASIFVNRLQFGPNEDFDCYPRTLEEDLAKLREQGCVDAVFAPSEKDMYPVEQTFRVKADPKLGDILEGFYRPGFFDGVATVVCKLFSIVRPDVAVFGKKDYQQLKIIQEMVSQFGMPIRIIGADLCRNPETGLALSSRNRYLSEDEKSRATQLYQTISGVKKQLESGTFAAGCDELEIAAKASLENAGWAVDYVAAVRRNDLLAPTRDDLINRVPLVVLAAAKIGTTRLIDNVEVF
jgi:pantoate--beta-alanine ligase